MNYRSLRDLNQTIVSRLWMIPADLGCVAGIPRSGMLPASLVALYRNLPLTDIDGLLAGRAFGSGGRRGGHPEPKSIPSGTKVLVLDDSVLTGTEMRRQRERLAPVGGRHRLVFGGVYGAKRHYDQVDFVLERVPAPRVFEWNLLHSTHMESACVDIDGVLCIDPTHEQNDDGPLYVDFIRSAQPLHVPTVPVGWIVTSRLEKYRDLTEEWLCEHGVEHRHLVMVDLPDKATRDRTHNHARFKARVFRSLPATLFVESSAHQAQPIADLAGKPAFCAQTREMLYPSPFANFTRTLASPGGVIAKLKGLARRDSRLFVSRPQRARARTAKCMRGTCAIRKGESCL